MVKKFLHIAIRKNDYVFLNKDVGMIPYSLAKYNNYESTLAWFYDENELHDVDFEKYCKLRYIGKYSEDRRVNIEKVKLFIKNYIKDYDVVMLFNYGSLNYKLAYLCKKYNPNIKVYIKLDMSESGFSHFYEQTFNRKVKNYFERLKSNYVDFFSVESEEFYKKLKNNAMFNGRLFYLPNGVSDLSIDVNKYDISNKENIVITVGRLGIYEKNNELLLESLLKIDYEVLKNWKIYLVGPATEEFYNMICKFKEDKRIGSHICYIGNVSDRKVLYDLYAKSKIISMTSITESFGIATIEGMYFGCYPVITNYGPAVKDITNNCSLGTVTNSENYYNGLENAMNNLNDSDNFILKKCAMYARNKFSYKNISGTLNNILSFR